ncbi:MauE/DoxX family redox-associated membrane protein [Actinoplanes auranticolor]|uniref:Methylamine utilisation protein MauE domain-containing protein n=1 Tax=Actinoplanes auranticolor TaxID=47988 RepID=A0A919VK65_9ACTN|nr:MauE/DoxX family redox-associated membrane protein [Actinoplanes auranticolor]GIM65826.1 hypothetical protein Aau02nite_20010 [Actinoplanes auranticolor]
MLVLSVAVLTIAGVLAVSLVSKVRSATAFRRFRDGVGDLGIPARLGTTAAVAAVLGESVTLGLVVVPATAAIGLFAAGSLFAILALVLWRAVARGTAASCHCFGSTKDTVAARHVARTGALAVLAYAAGVLDAAAYPSYLSSDPPAAIVAVAVSGVAVAAVVYLDELMWLFGGSPR